MDLAARRAKMVERLQQRGAFEDTRTAAALRSVPRHEFVPDSKQHLAYRETPLRIGQGQTISAPYIVARMVDLLQIQQGDEVLEIGTGCGYHAAVIAEVVGATLDNHTGGPVDTDTAAKPRSHPDMQRSQPDAGIAERTGVQSGAVYSVEYHDTLAKQAQRRLTRLGYDIQIRRGDGRDGWPEQAPYDHAYLTCAVPEIPDPVISQVRLHGYVLAPVGGRTQTLVRMRVTDSDTKRETFENVRFVPVQK